jgi:uncharacterized membrane protein YidH (DUF202 family)
MNTSSQPQLPVYAILRTRMSWIRTSLAVVVTGFLLVRGGITGTERPALAILAGFFAALLVATSLTRFTSLARRIPTVTPRQLPSVVVGGIVFLAVVACLQLVMLS